MDFPASRLLFQCFLLSEIPDEGFPLIVFSHGIGMCGDQSEFLAQYLASRGFVVVAPDHKDSRMCSVDMGMEMTSREIYRGFLKGRLDLGLTVKALFPEQVEMLKAILNIWLKFNGSTT